MFIKGSDDVSPTISSLDVDGKENRRLANNMKADKARKIEDVKLELYKETIKQVHFHLVSQRLRKIKMT